MAVRAEYIYNKKVDAIFMNEQKILPENFALYTLENLSPKFVGDTIIRVSLKSQAKKLKKVRSRSQKKI